MSSMIHQPPSPPILYAFDSTDELSERLAAFIVKAQSEALNKKGKFTVALSGGSLPKQLHKLIGKEAVMWDRWHVFFADERCVPLDHDDSNSSLCWKELFSKVPIPKHNIHTIDDTRLNDLEDLTDAYEDALISEFAQKDSARFPVFDLILLGIGADGHTCSLFPGHELLTEQDRWVAYLEDSPKPPPKRITLTFPVLNHALRVVFVATGESKADILSTILDDPGAGLPASRVRPSRPGQVFWYVDKAASAKAKYQKSEFRL